jgi:hypothetical protein
MENKSFFLVNSITYAMKSRDLLLHHGIASSVERSRKGKERYGCGYGVFVPKRAGEARKILEEHGIRILSPREGDDGP